MWRDKIVRVWWELSDQAMLIKNKWLMIDKTTQQWNVLKSTMFLE